MISALVSFGSSGAGAMATASTTVKDMGVNLVNNPSPRSSAAAIPGGQPPRMLTLC